MMLIFIKGLFNINKLCKGFVSVIEFVLCNGWHYMKFLVLYSGIDTGFTFCRDEIDKSKEKTETRHKS